MFIQLFDFRFRTATKKRVHIITIKEKILPEESHTHAQGPMTSHSPKKLERKEDSWKKIEEKELIIWIVI